MTSVELDVAAAGRLLRRPVSIVARLTGGEHAVTTLVTDGRHEYVVRRFPPGDTAVSHEVGVLARLTGLGELVPHLVAYDDNPAAPIIVTNRLAGTAPPPGLSPLTIATEMAHVLARIHALDGAGLRLAPARPPHGESPIARQARQDWRDLDLSARVLTHFDFWCGNAVWEDAVLSGVIDWSGARHAPRGLDVAWCRLDLVLLGSPSAADVFLGEYQERTSQRIFDVAAWDRQVAAYADTAVEEWAPNYAGVGRPHLTSELLRRRLDHWIQALLTAC